MPITLDIGPEPAVLAHDEALAREMRDVIAALEAIAARYLEQQAVEIWRGPIYPDDPRDPAQWDRFWATTMAADEHPEIFRPL
jgi:hypothetical protein